MSELTVERWNEEVFSLTGQHQQRFNQGPQMKGKGRWIAWIEPSGYVEAFQDMRTYVPYPQPPLGMKWKEGPELDALLKKGNAKQIVRYVEPLENEL